MHMQHESKTECKQLRLLLALSFLSTQGDVSTTSLVRTWIPSALMDVHSFNCLCHLGGMSVLVVVSDSFTCLPLRVSSTVCFSQFVSYSMCLHIYQITCWWCPAPPVSKIHSSPHLQLICLPVWLVVSGSSDVSIELCVSQSCNSCLSQSGKSCGSLDVPPPRRLRSMCLPIWESICLPIFAFQFG